MTRFYLRVDVQEGWSDSETQITTSDISFKEILEENERELKNLGYITPKAIKLQEKLGKTVPSSELMCVPTAYTRSAASELRNLVYGAYTLCFKVDPLTVLEGDSLDSYKKHLERKEADAKAAEAKKKANAKAKEERKLAAAKKLLESKGLKVNG